jgi:uncharacterized protein YbaR (Trm112 family)
MEIQVKSWNGIDDPDDPKTGTPGMTNEAVFEALRGRVISAVGGIDKHSDAVNILFTDETRVWFSVTKGVPRMLIYKGSKSK